MFTVNQTASAMQHVLNDLARPLARECRAVIRERNFTGASLAQALVFGWMEHPQATLEELAQAAACCGACLTPQAVDQKFTPRTARFFQELLNQTLQQVVSADALPQGLLKRFEAVWIEDSTTLPLPDELKEHWPGCGGSPGTSGAALKLHVRFDLCRGTLAGIEPTPARVSDLSRAMEIQALPPGSRAVSVWRTWAIFI